MWFRVTCSSWVGDEQLTIWCLKPMVIKSYSWGAGTMGGEGSGAVNHAAQPAYHTH